MLRPRLMCQCLRKFNEYKNHSDFKNKFGKINNIPTNKILTLTYPNYEKLTVKKIGDVNTYSQSDLIYYITQCKNSKIPLVASCWQGNIEKSIKLITNGKNNDFINEALIAATCSNNFLLVSYLLHLGADPSAYGSISIKIANFLKFENVISLLSIYIKSTDKHVINNH